MYFSGILHRDISLANIILVPKETLNNWNGSNDEDCGKLVDLEHAARAPRERRPEDIVIHEPPSEEQCAELEQLFSLSVQFDREVLVHAWQYYGEMRATTDFLERLWYSKYESIRTSRDHDSSESAPTGIENLPTITMNQLGWNTRVSNKQGTFRRS